MIRMPIDDKVFLNLYRRIAETGKSKMLDLTELQFILGHHYSMTDQKDSALYFYHQIDLTKVISLFGNANPVAIMPQVGHAISDLCHHGEFKEAYRFILAFKKPVNRSALYAFVAQELQLAKENSPFIDQLIDSSKAEMLRVERTGVDQQSRLQFPYALAMRNQGQDLQEAANSIKNVSFKLAVQQLIARSIAFHGQLYRSYESIPPATSKADRAVFDWFILHGYAEGNRESAIAWKDYTNYHRFWYQRPLIYDDETN